MMVDTLAMMEWYFNSLPHAEVDEKNAVELCDADLFQLTTSRRGRHFLIISTCLTFLISTHYLTQR